MGDMHVRSLLICNLPPQLHHSRSLIRHHFSKYSTVVQVVLNVQQDNCLIVFKSREDAEKAKTHGSSYKNVALNILWADPAQFDPRAADGVAKYEENMDWLKEDQNSISSDKHVRGKFKAKQEEAKDIKIGQMMLKHIKSNSTNKSNTTSVKLKKRSSVDRESYSFESKIKEKPKRSLVRKIEKVSKTKKSVKKEEVISIMEVQSTIDDPLFHLKTCISVKDKLAVLEERDRLIRKYYVKDANIATAGALIGICPDMCPERERLMREFRRLVHLYETTSDNGEMSHELVVKEYSRSSADQELPLPHDVRPEPVLTMTMAYLINNIMNKVEDANENISDWYDFCWNRLRSIRKDIIQQQLCALPTVSIVEQCARFHICCFDRLWGYDATVFDEQINTENLMNCLQTLIHMYEDLAKQNITCPNEAEFLAYTILLKLKNGDILWEFQQFSPTLQSSLPIQFAIQVHAAFHNNMYSKFFSLIKETNYLNACILQQFFANVRATALQAIVRAYCPPRKHGSIPADQVMLTLKFDNPQDAVVFCEAHGVMLQPNCTEFVLSRKAFVMSKSKVQMPMSSALIRSKRLSVPQAVVGRTNELPVYCAHEVHSSFDSNGKLNKSALDASDQERKCFLHFKSPEVSMEGLSSHQPAFNLGRAETDFKIRENNEPAYNSQPSTDISQNIDSTSFSVPIDDSIAVDSSEMLITDEPYASQDKGSFPVEEMTLNIPADQIENTNETVNYNKYLFDMDTEPSMCYNEEKTVTDDFLNFGQSSNKTSIISNQTDAVSKPDFGGFTFTGSLYQAKSETKNTFIDSVNDWKQKINLSASCSTELRPHQLEDNNRWQSGESAKLLANEVDSSFEEEIPIPCIPTVQPETLFSSKKTYNQSTSKTIINQASPVIIQHIIPTSGPKTVELEKVMEAFQRERDIASSDEVAEKVRLGNAKIVLVEKRKRKMEDAETMRKLKKDLRERLKIVSVRQFARLWKQKVERIKQRRFNFPVRVDLSIEEHVALWGTVKNKFPRKCSFVHRMKQNSIASKVVSQILEFGIEDSMTFIGDIVADTLIKQSVEKRQKKGIVNIAPVYWKVVFCIPDDIDNESTFGKKFSRWCKFAFYDDISAKFGSVKKIMTSFNIPVYLCVHLIQGSCTKLEDEITYQGMNALLWVEVIPSRSSHETRLNNLTLKKQHHPIPFVVMRIGPSCNDAEIERKADELKRKRLISSSCLLPWCGLPSILKGLSFLSENRHCSWSLCLDPLVTVVKRVSEELFDAIAKTVPMSQQLSQVVRNPNNVIQLFNICLRELTHILLSTKSENTPTFAPEFRPYFIKGNVSNALPSECGSRANVIFLKKISLPEIRDWSPATSYQLLTMLKQYCAALNCTQLLPTLFRIIDPPDDDQDFVDHLQAFSWISIVELFAIHVLNTSEQSSRHLVVLYNNDDIQHLIKSQWWLDSYVMKSMTCDA